MWIFMSDAMLSVVADRTNDANLLVRARRAGDIERVFPDVVAVEGVGTDYGWRASLPRERVAKAVTDGVTGITYPNFKGSVREPERHDAYMHVWAAMLAFQRAMRGVVPGLGVRRAARRGAR